MKLQSLKRDARNSWRKAVFGFSNSNSCFKSKWYCFNIRSGICSMTYLKISLIISNTNVTLIRTPIFAIRKPIPRLQHVEVVVLTNNFDISVTQSMFINKTVYTWHGFQESLSSIIFL